MNYNTYFTDWHQALINRTLPPCDNAPSKALIDRAVGEIHIGATLTFNGEQVSLEHAREEMREEHCLNALIESALYDDTQSAAAKIYHTLLKASIRSWVNLHFTSMSDYPQEWIDEDYNESILASKGL